MSNADWIVKVLSGVNIGAEVPLTEEDSVFGKSEDCDIVLDDVTLADRQLSLRLADDGAILTPLAESPQTYVAGEPIGSSPVGLSAYQMVTAGTLFLAVGPVQGEWPSVDVFQKERMAAAAVAEEEAPEDPEDELAAEKAEDAEHAAESDAPETATALTEATADEAASPDRLPPLSTLIGAAVTALVAAAGMVWLAAWLVEDMPSPAPEKPDLGAIRSIAAKYGADIDFHENKGNGGKLEVVGYVGDEEAYRKLVREISTHPVDLVISITNAQVLLVAAQAVVDRLLDERSQVTVSASRDSPGNLRFEGYVHDKQSLDQLKAVVARDVKRHRNAVYRIETQTDRLAKLRDMLDDQSMAHRVSVEMTVDGVDFYSADSDGPLDEKLSKIKRLFTAAYDGHPPIVWTPDRDYSTRTSTPINLQSVGFGQIPHIIVDSGIRYQVGDELESGYRIAAITPRFILMRREGMSAYHFLDMANAR